MVIVMELCVQECIILKQWNFRDRDRMVTFLAQGRGRFTGIARGARSLTGRGSSSFEPFTHGTIYFEVQPGRDLVKIKKCDPLPPHLFLNPSYDRYLLASYFSELLTLCPLGETEAEGFFSLLLDALKQLGQPDCPLPLLRLGFELDFMKLLGVAPRFSRCGNCGKVLFQKSSQGWDLLEAKAHQLDIHLGIRCPVCRSQGEGIMDLSPQAMAFVGHWRDPEYTGSLDTSSQVLGELERALTRHLLYHLERTPRALALLP